MTLQPDPAHIERFVSSLFRYAEQGSFISLRGFDQQDRGGPAFLIRGVAIGQDLTGVVSEATRAAGLVANATRPAVFAPPVATFRDAKRARTEDLVNGVAISVDLDSGDTMAKRRKLESVLGPATVAMHSGGEWLDGMTGELHRKMHLHWRLSEPTTTPEEHAQLQSARWLAALLVDVDRTAAPSAHPLRWPGSWNLKAAPRMAEIADEDPDAEVHLGDVLAALQEAVEAAGLGKSVTPGERASANPQAPADIVASALAALPNADVHWDDWVKVALATWGATGGSAAGLAAWEEWSAKSGKYVPQACVERWTHITAHPPSRIGAGTLFLMARAAGWQDPRWQARHGKPPMASLDESAFEAEAPPPHPDDPGPGPDEAGPYRRQHRQETGQVVWGEPVDFLTDDVTGLPVLEERHLPAALWPFVADLSARLGVEPFSAALVSVVCCASVISEDWRIQPKRNDTDWTEQARLWAAILGSPSTLKTPVLAACSKPIDKLDIAARRAHAAAMETYRAAKAAWDQAKKKKDEDPGPEPVAPRMDRYLVEGTTVEALQEVLRDDDQARFRAPLRKVMVRQDELSEFFAGLDRYNSGGKGGSDRGTYLRLYNGGRYTLDRIGRGSFAVPSWSACFIGGCQPDPIQKLAASATDDGLLQRFMFSVPGHQGIGLDQAPDRTAHERYEGLFPVLASLCPEAEIGLGRVRPVTIHPEGHAYREEVDAIVRAMCLLPSSSVRLQSTLGKWRGLFARLLLTFHLVEYADAAQQGQPTPYLKVVRPETAERVAAFMLDVLLPHMLRADALMFSTSQTGHAQWVAGYVLSKGIERLTVRDITRDYGALKAPEKHQELQSVMASLTAMGWLEPELSSNPAKPTHAWTVNPAVHVAFADRADRERTARETARDQAARDIARLTKKRATKGTRA